MISMKTHELKTWTEPFRAVMNGTKTHEVLRNDRDYKVGDTLHLREFDPDTVSYTGAFCYAEITYITQGGTCGLANDMCVMSICALAL